MGAMLNLPALRGSLPPDLAAQLTDQARAFLSAPPGGSVPGPPALAAPPAMPAPLPPPPAPIAAATPQGPAAPPPMPGMPNLHPVRNAVLGLLAGGPAGLFQQLQANDDKKLAMQRMQSVYAALPDEYKPLFVADPQGFLASYMKNIEPQVLKEGDMALYGGANGQRVLNAKKVIDEKSGKPVYLTEAGPVAFDSLGGDIKADNGLIVSSRTGVQGAYSTPQKLQMGESPGSFTPTVTGPGGSALPTPPGSRPMTPSTTPATPARGQVADAIRQRAQAAGLSDADAEALVRTAQLESSLNPGVRNNGSSTGLFQFHPDTFARLGGKNINDPNEQIDAAIRLYKNNGAALQAAGLPVTPTTLYLSHQQGLVATRALLEADPGVPAAQVLASVYAPQYGMQKGIRMAQLAITGNGGKPNMTAGQFVSMWDNRVKGVKPPPPGQEASAAAPQATAETAAPNPQAGAPGWNVGQPVGMSVAGNGAAGGLTGADYLKTLPPQIASQVKALAEGRMQFPGGFALKSPYWQQMIQSVTQYDPTFDAVNFNARASTRKAFTSGPIAQNLTALNTAIGHLTTLAQNIDGLRNFTGLASGLNGPVNAIYNATDPAYQKARAAYDAARGTVASELVRALRGSGGAEKDIKYWQDLFDPNKSPDALKSGVQTAAELIQSRLDPLRQQYQQGMGTTEDPFQVLFPKSATMLEKLSRATEAAPATSSRPAPVSQGQGWKVVAVH